MEHYRSLQAKIGFRKPVLPATLSRLSKQKSRFSRPFLKGRRDRAERRGSSLRPSRSFSSSWEVIPAPVEDTHDRLEFLGSPPISVDSLYRQMQPIHGNLASVVGQEDNEHPVLFQEATPILAPSISGSSNNAGVELVSQEDDGYPVLLAEPMSAPAASDTVSMPLPSPSLASINLADLELVADREDEEFPVSPKEVMPAPAATIADCPIHPDLELVHGQDIDRSLALVKELNEAVKKDMKIDGVETAILRLQQLLKEDNADDTEMHQIAHYHLARALITRFVCYGWEEDLDHCVTHLGNATNVLSRIMNNEQTVRDIGQNSHGLAKDAFELIQECRDTIDFPKLDAAINVAQETLPLCSESIVERRVVLLLELGTALVTKFLRWEEGTGLNEASTKFQNIVDILESHHPLKYLSLKWLQLIGALRVTETGKEEGLDEILLWSGKAEEEDQVAVESYEIGTQMMGGDESQIGEAITFLRAVSSLRALPHPKRALSLLTLSMALGRRFYQKHHLEDLAESITAAKDSLVLIPVPHRDRSDWLDALATSLYARFDHTGDFQSLEESIAFYRESLALRPAPHQGRLMTLNNLASAFMSRFNLTGDPQDLEKCISFQRETLVLTPASHPDRSSSFDNLAAVLRTQLNLGY